MKNKLFIVIALMGLTMLFSSCAKFPQTEINNATAAVDSAKVFGADVYVPEVYSALTDSLKLGVQQAEVEKSSFFKTYKVSKAKLDAVVVQAADAKTKTTARKVELETETHALLTEVTALVESNKVLLSKAPKGKDGKAALDAISTELEVITTTLVEVETICKSGDLLGANTKVKVAKDKAVLIKTELETAISKVKK